MFKLNKHKKWLLPASLLALLLVVLLLPAAGTVRTVEIQPDTKGTRLTNGATSESSIQVPAGTLDYFSVLIKKNHTGLAQRPAEYQAATVDIATPEGKLLREASRPRFLTRGGVPALQFSFPSLALAEPQLLHVTVTQPGDHELIVQQPQDVALENEQLAYAFKLERRATWLSLLLARIYDEDPTRHDIARYHHRGTQIVAGVNPYSCITDDSTSCIGYPSHLPGMYWFSAGLVTLGASELEDWMAMWRPVMLLAWLAVGGIIAALFFKQGRPAVAVAALGLWLFNRWSLYVLRVAHTDFVGVLFLLLTVLTTTRWPLLAAVLLGASLTVKQLAVLVVPLFLLYVWRQHGYSPVRLAVVAGLVLLVPLIAAGPFLLDNPGATVQGWLNAATRPAQTQYQSAPSLDLLLDVTDLGKSAVLLALVALVYLAAWRKSLTLAQGCLLLLAIQISFTHVLLHQYLVWLLPFIPLALWDAPSRESSA